MILRSSSLSAADLTPQKELGQDYNLRKSAVLNDAKLNSYHIPIPFHKTYPEDNHFAQEIVILQEKIHQLLPTYDGHSTIPYDDINDLSVAKQALHLQHQIIGKQQAYLQYSIEHQQHIPRAIGSQHKSSGTRDSPLSLDLHHRLLAQSGSTDSPRSGRTLLPPMVLYPIDTTACNAMTMIANNTDDSPGNSSQDSASTTTATSVVTANTILTNNLFGDILPPSDHNYGHHNHNNHMQSVPQLGRTHSPPAQQHPVADMALSTSASNTPTIAASRRKALSSLCSSRSKLGSSKRLVVKDIDFDTTPSDLSNEMLRMSSTCPLPTLTPLLTPEATPTISNVIKKTSQTAPVRPAEMTIPTLYIAHDNTLLGKQLTGPNSIQGSSYGGGKKGMTMMVESGITKEHLILVLGQLVFNGLWEEMPSHLLPATTSTTAALERNVSASARGSYALVLQDLTMITVHQLSTLSWRVCPANPQIIELHLFPTSQQLHSTEKMTIQTLQSTEQLINLFQPCTQRVDVILDPTSSSDSTGRWYPYYETSDPISSSRQGGNLNGLPKRKLAPQFRSSGRGYLRLGDDMSAYGTSFLSVDGGHTFLDALQGHDLLAPPGLISASTNSITTSTRPTNRSAHPNHPSSANKREKLTDSIRKTVLLQREDDANSVGGCITMVEGIQSEDEVKQALQQVQQHVLPLSSPSSSMKWSDKVQHLEQITTLCTHLMDYFTSNSSASICSFLTSHTSTATTNANAVASSFTLTGLISTLQSTLAKAVHPHLFTAFAKLFLVVVKLFSPEISRLLLCADDKKETKFASVWQTLLLEMMKSLKSSGNNTVVSGNGGSMKSGGISAKQNSNNNSNNSNNGGYVTLLHDCLFLSHELQLMTWHNYSSLLLTILSSSTTASTSVGNQKMSNKKPASTTSSFAANNSTWPTTTLTKVFHWYHLYYTRLLTSLSSNNDSSSLMKIAPKCDEELRNCLSQLLNCIIRFLDHREEPVRHHSLSLFLDLIILEYVYSCQTQSQPINSLVEMKYLSILLQSKPPLHLLCEYYASSLIPYLEKKFRKPIRQEESGETLNIGDSNEDILVMEKYDTLLKQILLQLFHPEEASIPDQPAPSSSSIKGSTSVRQKIKKSVGVPVASHKTEDPIEDTTILQHSTMWYECQLLFQTVPSSIEDWYRAIQVILTSPRVFLTITTFLTDINTSSQPVNNVHITMTIGQLLRVILPFTENTSSSDQTLSCTTSPINTTSTLAEAIQSSCFPQLLPHLQTLQTFQTQLLTIRKLIRVKIADEADYQQAKKAMQTLFEFVLKLYQHHVFVLPVLCSSSSSADDDDDDDDVESDGMATIKWNEVEKCQIDTIRSYVQCLS